MKTLKKSIQIGFIALISLFVLTGCCDENGQCAADSSSVSIGGFSSQIMAPINLPSQSIGGIGFTINLGF